MRRPSPPPSSKLSVNESRVANEPSVKYSVLQPEEQTMKNVAVQFRRPSGSERQQPSLAMKDALHRLGQSDEMQSLLVQASENGQRVTIEVFQNRSGEPILIHFKRGAA